MTVLPGRRGVVPGMVSMAAQRAVIPTSRGL